MPFRESTIWITQIQVRSSSKQQFLSAIFRYNHLVESSVNILLQTLKDNLKPSELTGLDKENYPCLYPESKQAKNNKGNRCWECMPCCYWSLFIFFNQRCIEALVKSKRQSLDAIKRRMQAASKHSKDSSDADTKSPALFKVSGSLGKFASFELSRFHPFPLPLPSFNQTFFSITLISAALSPSLYPFCILPPVWYLSLSALSSLPPLYSSVCSVCRSPCLRSYLVSHHCFLLFSRFPFIVPFSSISLFHLPCFFYSRRTLF